MSEPTNTNSDASTGTKPVTAVDRPMDPGRRRFIRNMSLAIGTIGAGSVLAACGDGTAQTTATTAAATSTTATTAAVAETTTTATTAAQAVLHIRVGSADPPPPGQRSRMMEWFEAEITEKTEGRITFENFFGGSLVGSGELLEAVESRVVEMAPYSAAWAAGKLPLWNFELAVPFRPNEPRLYNRIMHRLIDSVPAFAEEYARYNLKILNLTPMEEGYDLHATSPILTLDDLRGKKIAAPGTWMPLFVEDGGGSAVTMTAPDRYQGLQSGVIDGHILSLQWSSDFKLTEVAKHWTHVGLGNTSPGGIAINIDFWNELSDEDQQLFTDTAVAAEEHLFSLFDEDAARYRADAEAIGVTFYEMATEEKLKWAEAMRDYPAMWVEEVTAQGLNGQEIIDSFMQISEEEGWEWVRQWGQPA